MMNKLEKRWLLALSAAMYILAVSSWGCATKKQNLQNGYAFNEIVSAKELHLQKEGPSLDKETPKELPQMTSDEHERLGDVYFSRGDLGKAFAEYETALKLNGKDSGIHYKKGLLLVIGRMNEDAILEFQEALNKESKHALSHEGLGLAYFQMKKYEAAEAWFRKAVELNPKLWRAHNFLGIIYDYRKQYEEAIDEYKAAIAVKGNNGLLYNNLGISYFKTGDHENAITAFNKGLATRPADSRIHNNLGLVLAEMGRYREALEAFRKGGDEAQAYNNLGCIYLNHGKYEKAQHCFEKAIELKPTFYAKASENARKARLDHGLSFDSSGLTVETYLDEDIPPNKIIIKKRTWQKPDRLKSDNKVEENPLMPLIAEEVDAKPGKKKEASPRQPEASSTNTSIGKITASTPLTMTSSGSSE
jgi:Flp pilus assembly protein TadD